jgi:hypothetical protein
MNRSTSFCSNEVLEAEDLRKKSKLTAPKGQNTEMYVSTTPVVNYQSVEIQGDRGKRFIHSITKERITH